MGEGFDFIKELMKLGDIAVIDEEGNCIHKGSMENFTIEDIKFEEGDKMNKVREEKLVELQEKLEIMSDAVSAAQWLISSELDCEGTEGNLELKTILKLNRVEDELEACYDLIIEESL